VSAKIFRYVVRTPGVEPLAGFDNELQAKEYAEFRQANGYNMPLLVVDQYEQMQKEEARRKRVARILDAVRVLKEVA